MSIAENQGGICNLLTELRQNNGKVENNFFEALGFAYFGPINGHDIAGMENAFRQAQSYNGPCVIQVLTKKGYGYDKAEERPEAFHGTPPFYVETGNRIDKPGKPSWGHIMADTLAEMSEKDQRIIAITAAMKLGTGLSVTYAYKNNFSFRVFADYDYTRKTYTLDYNPAEFLNEGMLSLPFLLELDPELKEMLNPYQSIRRNRHTFTLGASFAVSF